MECCKKDRLKYCHVVGYDSSFRLSWGTGGAENMRLCSAIARSAAMRYSQETIRSYATKRLIVSNCTCC